MKNKMGLFIGFIAMLVLIAIIGVASVLAVPKGGSRMKVAFGGGRAELRNTIEIPLSDVDNLTLAYSSKNIKFYPATGDSIIIKEYLVYAEDVATVTYPGEKEVVVTGTQTNYIMFFGFMLDERIEVYLPKEGLKNLRASTFSGNISTQMGFVSESDMVEISAASGNITWQDTSAKEVSFKAGSGNIKLDHTSGNARVTTGSGNITVRGMEGVVEIQAGSGNVTVEDFAGNGSVKTASGTIKVESKGVTGDVALTAGSGNIRFEIPKETVAHVEIRTGSGNINTDFDDRLSYNKRGNEAIGDVGQGQGVSVEIKTGSGNVRVSYR